MRKIKFRAWDKETGKMFYDVSIRENNFCVYREEAGLLSISGRISENSSIIIEQYTGLKDKNGKEIYEGDKIEYKTAYDTYKGIVFWSKTQMAFRCELGATILNGALSEYVEIIGTIHSDPELLKEDSDA
jgi:uncharacterized phage protein (TIGR01671 family)